MKDSNYRWTIRLALLTPLLALISLFLMGGGHGWYTPTMALFPLGTLNVIWDDHLSIPLLLVGLLQYPLYGLLIDRAKSITQRRTHTILIIVFHLVLAAIIISFRSSHWK
jgi:hypothetical protein